MELQNRIKSLFTNLECITVIKASGPCHWSNLPQL